jgi:hypothetical protein
MSCNRSPSSSSPSSRNISGQNSSPSSEISSSSPSSCLSEAQARLPRISGQSSDAMLPPSVCLLPLQSSVCNTCEHRSLNNQNSGQGISVRGDEQIGKRVPGHAWQQSGQSGAAPRVRPPAWQAKLALELAASCGARRRGCRLCCRGGRRGVWGGRGVGQCWCCCCGPPRQVCKA